MVFSSPKMIDFSRGHPNSSLLPAEETRDILEKLANANESHDVLRTAVQYGPGAGSKDLIRELKSFLERQTRDDDFGDTEEQVHARSASYPEADLFVTCGVSHGIELLCATQTQSGDVVLVERPSYFLVGGIFKSHGLDIQGLPMKSLGCGVNVDRLVEMVEMGMMKQPRMIYIIPTHQNPTGHTMSIEDRIKLATLASRHGILVVADEVYHLLDWRKVDTDGARPARMASLSALVRSSDGPSSGGCVSVSSFTKIFAPGIRCGWIEGTPDVIDALVNYGYIQSQGGCCPFVGEIMKAALSSGIADDILSGLRQKFKERADKLCTALEVERRIQVVDRPLGGYFAWIKFPSSVNSHELLKYCDGKVKFMPGAWCDIVAHSNVDKLKDEDQTDFFESHVRLCFADLDVDLLEQGIQELISCFREYMIMLAS